MALFKKKRDGSISVHLNGAGRAFVGEIFNQVVAAENDPHHEWHLAMNPPINPSANSDDPLATFSRQKEMASNSELAQMTINEDTLNPGEAYAWMTSLNLALRATVGLHNLSDEESLQMLDPEIRQYVVSIQSLLFGLADCL
jgi:hypothetical protein